MKLKYTTKGVCASQILFEVEDDIVSNVKFMSGCNGNLQAIGKLVEGMKTDEVIKKLRGISCGHKGTSCADQLATALERYNTNGAQS